jgi:hypothetical protein
MKLSDTEKAMIHKLRRAERNWQCFGRWLFFFFGIIYGVLFFWLLSLLINARRPLNQTERLFLSMLIPMSVSLCFGCIAGSLSYWEGNPTRCLLLKAIDHLNQQDPKGDIPSDTEKN